MRRPGSGGVVKPGDKPTEVVRDGPGMPTYWFSGRDAAGAGKGAHNLGDMPERDPRFPRHDPDDPEVLNRLFHVAVDD